jgi:hypothetical protein
LIVVLDSQALAPKPPASQTTISGADASTCVELAKASSLRQSASAAPCACAYMLEAIKTNQNVRVTLNPMTTFHGGIRTDGIVAAFPHDSFAGQGSTG